MEFLKFIQEQNLIISIIIVLLSFLVFFLSFCDEKKYIIKGIRYILVIKSSIILLISALFFIKVIDNKEKINEVNSKIEIINTKLNKFINKYEN